MTLGELVVLQVIVLRVNALVENVEADLLEMDAKHRTIVQVVDVIGRTYENNVFLNYLMERIATKILIVKPANVLKNLVKGHVGIKFREAAAIGLENAQGMLVYPFAILAIFVTFNIVKSCIHLLQ